MSGIVAILETIRAGGCMGHEWIISVLKDMTSYARANGLTALATKAEETLRVAEVEISDAARSTAPAGSFETAHKAH